MIRPAVAVPFTNTEGLGRAAAALDGCEAHLAECGRTADRRGEHWRLRSAKMASSGRLDREDRDGYHASDEIARRHACFDGPIGQANLGNVLDQPQKISCIN